MKPHVIKHTGSADMINQHGRQGKQFEGTTTDSLLKMIKAMERLIELIIHIGNLFPPQAVFAQTHLKWFSFFLFLPHNFLMSIYHFPA